MGYTSKMTQNQQSEPPYLYIYEPPVQKFWFAPALTFKMFFKVPHGAAQIEIECVLHITQAICIISN